MKKIIFLLCCTLYAQNPNTAVFPGGIATDNDLLVANDSAQTTLSGGINSAVTSIVLSDGSKFLYFPMAITVDAERMKCTSRSGNTLTCARGQYGTTAVSHGSKAKVLGNIIIGWHHNQIAAEVKALETAVSTSPTIPNILAGGALLTGGGSRIVQSPNPAATMDANGNISTPGTVSSGVGTGNAGFSGFSEGTLPTALANEIVITAPTSVPSSYVVVLPSAPGVVGQTLVTDGGTPQTLSWVDNTRTRTSIVSSLPTCNAGAEGTIKGVTDALAPAFLVTVAGGGSVHVPVYCDGTNWVVI